MKRWIKAPAVLFTGFVVVGAPAWAGEATCDSGAEDVAVIRAHIEDGRFGHQFEDPVMTAAAYANVSTSINRGKITLVTRQSIEERFAAYYETVDILESTWLAEPEIAMLESGCNAWSTATMLVRMSFTNAAGEEQIARYEFAWTSLWQKDEDGYWARVMMTSTDDGGTLE